MLFRSHHSSFGLPLIRITFPIAEQWKGAMVRPNRKKALDCCTLHADEGGACSMLRYRNGNDAALRREFGEFGVETPSPPSELREQCFLTGAPSSSSIGVEFLPLTCPSRQAYIFWHRSASPVLTIPPPPPFTELTIFDKHKYIDRGTSSEFPIFPSCHCGRQL